MSTLSVVGSAAWRNAPSPARPSSTTATRRVGSDGNARTARIAATPPATAPSAAGNPSRGAAAAPIAPRASALTTATGRHGDPGAPGSRRSRGEDRCSQRLEGDRAGRRRRPGDAHVRGAHPLHGPVVGWGRGRAAHRVREPAPELARVGDRRRARTVRLRSSRGAAGSHARGPRARSRPPGSRRSPRASPAPRGRRVPSDRRRARRLRSRAGRARARRARRAARSSASGRAAPRRRERTGGPCARGRRRCRRPASAAGASTRGRTGCTIAPAVRARGATVIGAGSATRAWRVRTKTPSGADVRICTRTWSNTPRRVATCGMMPSVGADVRHHRPLGSSTRISTRDARPRTCTCRRTSSPTVASDGADDRDLDARQRDDRPDDPDREQREGEDADRDHALLAGDAARPRRRTRRA